MGRLRILLSTRPVRTVLDREKLDRSVPIFPHEAREGQQAFVPFVLSVTDSHSLRVVRITNVDNKKEHTHTKHHSSRMVRERMGSSALFSHCE